MNKIIFVLLACVSAVKMGQDDTDTETDTVQKNNFTMELENYNGWNLPYAHTVNVEINQKETNNSGLGHFILPNNYTLECSLNAF